MATIAESRLTSKGQVTVPEEIRRALRLRAGDRIEWRTEAGAVVVRRVVTDFRDLVGMLGPARRRSVAEMDAGIREHLRARHGDHRRR
jgi:AbrB family looped-hinge helix DNA binding protein